MNLEVSIWAATLAGLFSFLSPCVLPLVPPYLVFISGLSLDELKQDGGAASRNQYYRVLLVALAFVLGFTTVFVALGATASYFGQLVRSELPLLARIAGIFIIIMGLNFLGVFKLRFLSREARYYQERNPSGSVWVRNSNPNRFTVASRNVIMSRNFQVVSICSKGNGGFAG